MANIKSAAKRIKVNAVKRQRNTSAKSSIKSSIRKFETAVAQGDSEQGNALYAQISSRLDKAASKGIIHKNKAARSKSRLAAKL